MSKQEIRSTVTELQAAGNTLTGYIAHFDSLSEDLGGFRELLAPGCFASSLAAGTAIRALVNHNTDHCIGNTAAGTLQLREDAKGLAFTCELPDTQAARDLKISVSRGDVTGASFRFATKADSWAADATGSTTRTVKDVELYEVSPGCTFPAYESPEVKLRTLFPDGAITVPETRGDPMPEMPVDTNDTGCQCDSAQCEGDACPLCSNADCTDANCDCQQIRSLILAVRVAQEF